MGFLKKRANAWIVTLLVIILATLIGANTSLNKIRQEAEDVFFIGEDKDGTGIQHDIEMIISDSYNLTVVAARYIDEENRLIVDVRKNKDILGKSNTPHEKYEGTQELLNSVMELYTYMGDLNLSEKDKNFRISIYDNIKSHNIIISRSTYNHYAKEFNKEISRFPANILSTITLVPPLELFD